MSIARSSFNFFRFSLELDTSCLISSNLNFFPLHMTTLPLFDPFCRRKYFLRGFLKPIAFKGTNWTCCSSCITPHSFSRGNIIFLMCLSLFKQKHTLKYLARIGDHTRKVVLFMPNFPSSPITSKIKSVPQSSISDFLQRAHLTRVTCWRRYNENLLSSARLIIFLGYRVEFRWCMFLSGVPLLLAKQRTPYSRVSKQTQKSFNWCGLVYLRLYLVTLKISLGLMELTLCFMWGLNSLGNFKYHLTRWHVYFLRYTMKFQGVLSRILSPSSFHSLHPQLFFNFWGRCLSTCTLKIISSSGLCALLLI